MQGFLPVLQKPLCLSHDLSHSRHSQQHLHGAAPVELLCLTYLIVQDCYRTSQHNLFIVLLYLKLSWHSQQGFNTAPVFARIGWGSGT